MKWMSWGPEDLNNSSLELYDEIARLINEEADELQRIRDQNAG